MKCISDAGQSWFWVCHKASDPSLPLGELAILRLVPTEVTQRIPGHCSPVFQKMLVLCGPREPGTECRRSFEMTGTVAGCLGRNLSYLLLSGRGTRSSLWSSCSRHSSRCPQLPKNHLVSVVSHSLQTILCHLFPTLWFHRLKDMSVRSWFLRWKLYNLRKKRKGKEFGGEIHKNFTNGKLVLKRQPGTGDFLSLGLRFAWQREVSWLEKLGEGMCVQMGWVENLLEGGVRE